MNKVVKLSEITGLSQFKLRSILGAEIIKFDFADFSEGKEYLRKMDKDDPLRADVILALIPIASSIEDCKFLFSSINFMGVLEDLVIKKWLELIQTSEETRGLYNELPNGSILQREVFLIWEKISIKEIEEAKNSFEAKKCFFNSPEKSYARRFALQKWDILLSFEVAVCDDVRLAKELYERAPENKNSKEEAFIKWDIISMSLVRRIKNTKEAEKAYFSSPPDGTARMSIMLKWRKLCRSTEHFRNLCFSTPFGSVEEKNAFNSFNSYLLAKINKTEKIEELVNIIQESFSGMEAESVAIKKINSLL